MNSAQQVWWMQSQSDHAVLVHLRKGGASECHLLHYLQMATEKLSKAYLWRSGEAPTKSHTGLVRFLKALLDRGRDLDRIANLFGFQRRADFIYWLKSIQPLAYSLQSLAPAEAGDGPNPEYPWPHESPTFCPAVHSFDLWRDLTGTGQGRKLLEFIAVAVQRFEEYA